MLCFPYPSEWDDRRTHNDVNEMTSRDLDSTPGTTGDNYSQTSDVLGQMTDDGTDYEYVWDAAARFKDPSVPGRLCVEHPNYRRESSIEGATR